MYVQTHMYLGTRTHTCTQYIYIYIYIYIHILYILYIYIYIYIHTHTHTHTHTQNVFVRLCVYDDEDEERRKKLNKERAAAPVVVVVVVVVAVVVEKFDSHLENMMRSDGHTNSWATEAEILATSKSYKIIFVLREQYRNTGWQKFSFDKECNHNKKTIKILNTANHFKLVTDEKRVCICVERS